MSLHQSIERQEREFKDLLQKVMQAPLSPLADSVQELKERMNRLEQLVSDMQADLSVLSLGAQNTSKDIRSLKSVTEDTSREVQSVLQTLFEKFQAHLEQGAQQRISQVAKDLAGLLTYTEQQTANHVAGLKDAIAASQGAIESSQKQDFENLGNLQQSTRAQLRTECENLRGDVGSQLAKQSAEGQRAIVRVQELLSLHSKDLRQQSSSGLRQLGDEADARMSQLTQYMEQLQTVLSAQQQQLEHLQQEQAASSERLGRQLQQALQPLRMWVIASVCVAAISLASVLALVAGRL